MTTVNTSWGAPAPQPPAPPPQPKQLMNIYDSTIYLNKPDAATIQSTYGMLPTVTPAQQFMFTNVNGVWEPNAAAIVLKAKEAEAANQLFVFDYETVEICPPTLMQAIAIARGASSKIKIGAFCFAPQCGPIVGQSLQYPWAAASWMANNAAMEPLVGMLDVLCPGLYQTTPIADWQPVATLMLVEARRYNKPILPFIWPYNDGNGSVLSQDFWGILNTCKCLADGAVIWGGYQHQWDANAVWLGDVKQFSR